MDSREVRDICKKCGGTRIATLDGEHRRYEVLFPSRCEQKDRCEEELIRALQIEPVRTPDGELVRN
jgi:hypothetical protein